MTTVDARPRWLGPSGHPLDFLGPAPILVGEVPMRAAAIAAAFPLNPPREWFTSKPAWLQRGQKMTAVTEGPEAGRVAGYVAPWGQCLLGGDPGKCFTAPSSPTGYAAAMQGDTLTAEGDVVRTANVGGGINHAPVRPGEFSQRIVDHYANTAAQTMRVVYGEDDYGIYACGALWPDVDDLTVAKVRASALSGDWRWRPELAAYDMAGSQLVSVPGYPLIAAAQSPCEAHPILVGGMGGVPAGMLEEFPMTQTATTQGVTACSCGGAPVPAIEEQVAALEAAATAALTRASELRAAGHLPAAVAAPPTAVPVAPGAEEQTDGDQAVDDALAERVSNLEEAVSQIADGLGELTQWMADQAVAGVDEDPMVAAPPPRQPPPNPPKGNPPAAEQPGGAHAFTDDNGDGKCDVCGKAEDTHAKEPVAA